MPIPDWGQCIVFITAPAKEAMPSNDPNESVRNILKRKKASLQQAKLEQGSPSWNELLDLLWKDIENGAQGRKTGYQTIRKLLTDKRFDK